MAETTPNKVIIDHISRQARVNEVVAESIVRDIVGEYQNRAANYFQKSDFASEVFDSGRKFDDLGNGESAAYGLMRAIWEFDNGCKARIVIIKSDGDLNKEHLDLQCERELNHELSSADTHKSGDYEWVSQS